MSEHECDLFLLSSHNPYQANQSLFNFARLGSRNINGWGIGFYRGSKSQVIRSADPAIENGFVDKVFTKVSEAISSNTILGHLRYTSRGENIVENNHPFS